MSKKAIISVISFSAFILVASVVIFYALGFRFQNNQIYGTGILVVTSTPNGATVKLDDKVTGATNTTISALKPGDYSLTITKEGYFDWTNQVKIEQEKVLTVKALMVPVNPSLAPITSTPAQRTLLSPDGQKLLYTVNSGTSAGVWVLDLSSQPFNLSRKPIQVAEDSTDLPYSTAQFQWSPSSKDVLMTLDPANPLTAYLVSIDNPMQVRHIPDTVNDLKAQWQTESDTNFKELTANFPKDIQQTIQDNQATIQWSPDNLKFLYQTEVDGKYQYQVYNKETKKSYQSFTHTKESLATVRWYADSEHLIILEKDNLEATSGSVNTIAMDGSNKHQLFSGTLIGDTLYTYLNGSKLVILSSFNMQEPTYYLYAINLQ